MPTISNPLKLNRFYYILTAIIVGIFAQIGLSNQHVQLAVILYIISISLFLYGSAYNLNPTIKISFFKTTQPVEIPRITIILTGLALLFALIAFFAFSSDKLLTLAWIMHLTSIILILIAVLLIPKIKSNKDNKKSKLKVKKYLPFLIIFLVAIFLRLYKLDKLPFGFWFDEADNGLNALQILTTSGYYLGG